MLEGRRWAENLTYCTRKKQRKGDLSYKYTCDVQSCVLEGDENWPRREALSVAEFFTGLPRDETWDSPKAESLCTTLPGQGKLSGILLVNYTRHSFFFQFPLHLLEACVKVMFIAVF